MKSFIFCGIRPCSPLKSTDVSEEYVASILRVFRVEELRQASNQNEIRWLLTSGTWSFQCGRTLCLHLQDKTAFLLLFPEESNI
jgi:hypothetical protein